MSDHAEGSAAEGTQKSLRVLCIAASDATAERLRAELRRGGHDVTWVRVDTPERLRAEIAERRFDVALSEYELERFGAVDALALIERAGVDLPLIVVAGAIGEERAVESIHAGAQDFVLEGSHERLLAAIQRALRGTERRREQRAIEAALRKSESKYRKIVETAREGIWVIGPDRRITYLNGRMAEMLGGDVQSLVGASLLDFVDEEQRAVTLRCIDGEPKTPTEMHELKFRRRDGSEFCASLSTSPVTSEDGRLEGVLAMVTDMTEQRKLQAQLMVSDRLVSVGTLAAGVAHEINNPLASVIANLELVAPAMRALARELGASAPQMPELCDQIGDATEAARRVQNIVRDLKVFSRAQEEALGAVDVRSVLDSVIRLAWNDIRYRARLTKDYQKVPPVLANASRLGQVFLNLLINAVQAIPEGQVDRHEIRLSAHPLGGGRVAVEVRDTGCGMSAEVLGRLFTPFYTTKPVGVGTGLGLSICHQIVSALGGEISVESEVGKGSTFKVVLASAESAPQSVAPTTLAPQAAARRGRILVVDDEPMMVKVIERMLAQDHEVVATTSPRQALAWFASGERYDLVLCDLMMPHVTGMDLYEELARTAPDQAARVVFLTGGAFTPRMREFLDRVENPRVEKPFQPATLRAVIHAKLGA